MPRPLTFVKKMKFLILVITVALVAESALGQTEKLPDESTALLKKLREWELQKQIELKAEIQEKRKAAVAILEHHLQAATKSGSLDVAIAIRNEIERLNRGISAEGDAGPPGKEDQDWYIGTRWKLVKGNQGTGELEIVDGKVRSVGSAHFYEYKVSQDGKLSYKGPYREVTLQFSADRKSGTYSDDQGTKGTIELIKTKSK